MMFDDRVCIQIAVAECRPFLEWFPPEQGDFGPIQSLVQIPVL
jgi:hypothetical protein